MLMFWIRIAALSAMVSPAPPTECLLAPVHAPIVVNFAVPACVWCPGQRGIEYALGSSVTVQAAAAGSVTFSGLVVGVRYVVVAQTDGLLATYGMLADNVVRAGERVSAGQIVGHASIRLYFGLRLDGVYVDPVPRLGMPSGRARLVPADGSRARPTRDGHPTCRIQTESGLEQHLHPISSPTALATRQAITSTASCSHCGRFGAVRDAR